MIFQTKATLIILGLSLVSNVWSQSKSPNELGLDIQKARVAGITAQQEKDIQILKIEVDELQLRAIQLINEVGISANDRFSNEQEKEEARHNYSSFITRFQGIREDRLALELKGIFPDYQTLQNYSQRLERLIKDIQNF